MYIEKSIMEMMRRIRLRWFECLEQKIADDWVSTFKWLIGKAKENVVGAH